MRRAELLDVVNMTSTTFDALAARSLLPFPGGRAGSGWAQYRPEDALRLMLLKELTRAGTPQVRASGLVRNHFERLIDYAAGDPKPKLAPLMFGLMSVHSVTHGADEPTIETDLHLTGVLSSMDEAVTSALKAAGSRPDDVGEVRWINASRCMRLVHDRARGTTANTMDMRALAAFLRAST